MPNVAITKTTSKHLGKQWNNSGKRMFLKEQSHNLKEVREHNTFIKQEQNRMLL